MSHAQIVVNELILKCSNIIFDEIQDKSERSKDNLLGEDLFVNYIVFKTPASA